MISWESTAQISVSGYVKWFLNVHNLTFRDALINFNDTQFVILRAKIVYASATKPRELRHDAVGYTRYVFNHIFWWHNVPQTGQFVTT